MDPGLLAERRKASFPVRQLTYFIDEGKERTERREHFRSLIAKDPFFDKKDLIFLSIPERYRRALETVCHLQFYRQKYKLDPRDFDLLRREALALETPTSLHDIAFTPFIKSQGSPEQVAKWYPLAESYAIIGCYAQTELGHGSNVQGLETVATYIPETEEFDLHTPTLTSTKWWPGGVAKTATHAIVMARLITKGRDFGVHAFIVQVRSLDDHRTLPRVHVGTIGPKMGGNAIDNGFLRLDHFRVPRENMLMRFAKVERDGTYAKPPHSKLGYVGMLSVRTGIVQEASNVLSRAVTIAVRYSVVRRQFPEGGDFSKPEVPIIDYTMQQYRVMPYLAAAYALLCTGRYMHKLFVRLMEGISSSTSSIDLSILPEVHATSSGLKSLVTFIASQGIEECRRACGGHGFLLSGGLAELSRGYVGVVTAEGDNYLLTQQTGRYLIKALRDAQTGKKLVGSVTYLQSVASLLQEKSEVSSEEDLLNMNAILHALSHRAARLVVQTAQQLLAATQGGKQFHEAWNDVLVEVAAISKAHCLYVIVLSFVDTLDTEVKQSYPELLPVLQRLCYFFALHAIEQDIGDFLWDGYFSSSQAALVQSTVRGLLKALRPDAVSLVDAFDISDHALASALGRYDGNVYQALWESAQRDPMNQEDVDPAYEAIKPLLKGTLSARL